MRRERSGKITSKIIAELITIIIAPSYAITIINNEKPALLPVEFSIIVSVVVLPLHMLYEKVLHNEPAV